jgi:hypothetical protein
LKIEFDIIKFANVCVNVTWKSFQIANCLSECYMIIFWKSSFIIKFADCLCECYMIIIWHYQVRKLFMWMLHNNLLKIEFAIIKFTDCLYKCQMTLKKKRVWHYIHKLFMWMLHMIKFWHYQVHYVLQDTWCSLTVHIFLYFQVSSLVLFVWMLRDEWWWCFKFIVRAIHINFDFDISSSSPCIDLVLSLFL